MRKLYISIIFCLFSLCLATAQNKTQACKLFSQGEYAKAKPMFEKLLKKTPNSAELNYWYAICCLETGDSVDFRPMLEYAASREIANAYRYLGDILYSERNIPAAIENYENFVDATDNDSLCAVYQKKLSEATRYRRRVMNCEKICIIDSVVVDKKEFLSAYKMGDEVGYITTNALFFDDESLPGYLNCSERGFDIYFSDYDEDAEAMRLFHNSKVGDEWGRAVQLKGFDTKGNDDYPFMLADGVTLYFASDGEGSIGGYDLFVTRLDTESGRFLRPDNLSMPFNSMANDYMLAINEEINIGWFASDRNQPEGFVCVYMFIPNPEKVRYDESLGFDRLLQYAEISSIADTQTDEDMVRHARQQLAMMMYDKDTELRKEDFLFVIDDNYDYNNLSDFKSEEARALFQEWQNSTKKLKADILLLDKKRDEYASVSKAEKANMAQEILSLENSVEEEEKRLSQLEYEIRRIEQNEIYK